jgi:dihydroorotase
MKTLIKNVFIVNEGEKFLGNIIIDGDKISYISADLPAQIQLNQFQIIDGAGKIAIPGVIDDQVHFRDPGLTHKGDIFSESRAAIAGGVTSFMEMPNTNPQTTSQDALNQKFDLGAQKSLANYSFYMGATNDNLKEIIQLDARNVCGIKIFMGSSTGNMLVDQKKALEGIFAEAPCLITTHCEDETTIRNNLELYKAKFGEHIQPMHHPEIRSAEACYISSAKAVELATKYGSQLHVLHLSTARELALFDAGLVENKKITAEVCVHHLWFDNRDYEKYGYRIKWNPAIKYESDKEALLNGLLLHKLDVIATDHAPHTQDEKTNSYLKSASGGPMVQHSLVAMLEMVKQGKLTLDDVVLKMCHAPATLYKIEKRGFLREGYFADIVLFDLNQEFTVSPENILYKCKWSPFEGTTFHSKVSHTFVNGKLVFDNGQIDETNRGMSLTFMR